MSVRRILAKTIDTDLEYEAIGIDLAKNCVSAALLTTDSEVVCIDRLDYSELEKSAQVLTPTTFAMEPCTEMNYLVQKLEAWGHRCLVIGGKNVQNYVENHYSGTIYQAISTDNCVFKRNLLGLGIKYFKRN